MIRTILITVSTTLVLISPLVYAHSIIKGQTRPHRTTRFVLLVISLLSMTALLHNKGAAFYLAFASAIQALMIFVLCIRRGMGGWARLDIVCLIVALLGIGLWQATGQAIVGLCAAIVADFIGCVPALVKTYHHPETEDWRFFAMDTLASTLSLAAIAEISAYALSYPIYIFLINVTFLVIIFGRKGTGRAATIKI